MTFHAAADTLCVAMDTENAAHLIRNARIVKPDEIVRGDLLLEGGIIAYAGGPLDERDGHTVIDGEGLYALPGFIDIHAHGGNGFDATMGTYDRRRPSGFPSVRVSSFLSALVQACLGVISLRTGSASSSSDQSKPPQCGSDDLLPPTC